MIRSAKWKEGFRGPVKADIALAEVEKIREKHGSVTPAELVRSARAKRSPLHRAFEWSDQKAGERFRESQARRILRNLVIVTITDTTERRLEPAYVSVSISADPKKPEQRAYVRVVDALADEKMRKEALSDCLRLLAGIRRRYSQLESLVQILDNTEEELKAALG